MEQLNKVTLRGTVGHINITEAQGAKMGRLSVGTTRIYKSKSAGLAMETTWTPVVAFESEKVNFTGLAKGSKVEITGRLKNTSYTAADGTEKSTLDVIAETLIILND